MKIRGAGILIHISSLPSRFGIGDLGPSSYRFVTFLADAHIHYWQILPLNPTDPRYDNSPYHCLSAFGTNPLLISPEKMVQDGYLREEEIKNPPVFSDSAVEYERVTEYKNSLFNLAYTRFTKTDDPEYITFCRKNGWWLDDHALFFALKKKQGNIPWSEWPDELKFHHSHSIDLIKEDMEESIEREKFLQYIFMIQWNDLKEYCRQHNVMIIGDLPIYVDYDSVDVWMNPQMFNLDSSLTPITVSGVPPDYFSSTGQLWENPIYNWNYLSETGYTWWIQRFERNIQFVDFLRIDHFRGLVAYWEVPYGETNAINGWWKEVPIKDFLGHLLLKLPTFPVIAEDLGIITPDVREILRTYQIPGMKVLLFAFSEDIGENPYIFHNHEKDCILYTGTHDNNPIMGWFHHEIGMEEKNRLFAYLGREIPDSELAWTLIRMAMMSVANTVVIPMQDILGLDTDARMNNPAVNINNWRWRLVEGSIRPDLSESLHEIITMYWRG